MTYRGYDYVGLDIFPYNQTIDKFREDVIFHIEKGLEFSERDGAKGVILSEIGVQVGELGGRSFYNQNPFLSGLSRKSLQNIF